MQPKDLEKMPLQVESLFYDLQNRVMADVVRRIEKTGGITSTADYQLEKMQIFGNSTEFIESEIKRLTKAADMVVYGLYDEVVDKDYTRNKGLYEQVNAKFIPYEDNEVLQTWTKAIVAQTQGDIRNITKSMGFSLNYGGKQVFTPFSEYYQKNLDRACMDIVTGSFSYNTVLRRVVKEMTASGIRTVDYASGYSSRATVASKRAIMTGVNQLCGQINDKNAEELGTDTFEVTAHANARPSHRSWQGQVFTKKQLVSICGLGSVDGLEGANCRHNHMAFIPGISVRTHTDEQLRNMAEKEDTPFTWQGKEYKGHEASQQQRQMETVMRKQRGDVKLLQQGKADADEIMAAKSRYLNTLHQYQGFSKKGGMSEQMEKVYMDGLGRIAGTTIPKMKRKVKNTGTFEPLQVPMQKKYVTKVAEKYGIKIDDLNIKIQRDKGLMNLFIYGSTDYNNVGRIDLFPRAFENEEELARTMIHERCHVLQLKKYGRQYTQENLNLMEKDAYKFEEFWYNILRKKVK